MTAVCSPSQYYPGCTVTPEKTNEITSVRELCRKIDLDGKLVSIDAIHTRKETSTIIVQECGGHYLHTVKDNQPGLRKQIEKHVGDPASLFLTPQTNPGACASKASKKANQ